MWNQELLLWGHQEICPQWNQELQVLLWGHQEIDRTEIWNYIQLLTFSVKLIVLPDFATANFMVAGV